MCRLASRRICEFVAAAVFAAVVLALVAAPCAAATVLFAEDFEGVPLQTSPTYGAPNAFSQDPPPGWDILSQVPPGGVPEWRGWSFARKGFWQAVGAANGDRLGRGHFQRGAGTIAVADPDLWNSPQTSGTGDPANRQGFFNSLLITPQIDLSPRLTTEDRLTLAFDSSWMGVECCDDGSQLDPPLRFRNNQTAIVRVRINGGAPLELLRWESAPFVDPNGFPTDQPQGPTGTPNTPNPDYRPFNLDERVFVDLSGLPLPLITLSGDDAPFALMNSGESDNVQIEFGMEDAGDDGWWAIDNVELASFGTLLGDMNYSGDLDVGDYDAFALGMLDTDAYRTDFFGAFPVENGSLDSVFDFDDIPWFLSVMEGVGAPSSAYAMAFFGIPEPASGTLLVAAGLLVACRRRGV